MGFFAQVHKVVGLIPEGRVMSYGDIAETLGSAKKARYVGFAMRFCPSELPWQRVVKQNGRVVTGRLQEMVLRKEGVEVSEDGFVNMDKYKLYPAEMQMLLSGAER